MSRGKTLEELWDMAESAWGLWPWAKLRISYEDLSKAVELFDKNRVPGTEGYLKSPDQLKDASGTPR